VRVLKALDLKIEMEEGAAGRRAVDATGDPYPDATQKLAQAADAVLLGAVGGPQWDNNPREQRPERGLLGIRKQLGLFANLRPAILYPELANASTLKPEVVAGLDILIVRELTGDIYFGQPRGIETREVETAKSASASTPCITPRARSAASLRVAFEAARKRNKQAVLGGQDERAGMHPAVARRGDRDGRRNTRTSSCRTCWWTTPPCNW
jgi:3-isopropylmalate dehydrogenase